MAWKAKEIVDASGRVFAGPRETVAGAGVGEALGAEPYPVRIEGLSWNRCIGPAGPGMLVTVEASPARLLPADAQALVWLQYDEESYFEAALDDYSDADGDLCAAGERQSQDRNAARFAVYLPWVAVPAAKGECLCQISLVTDDELLGNEWFELTLPGRATREVHSALGALAYAAVAMLQRSREPTQRALAAAVRWLSECFGLDEDGQQCAAELLERAARQRPGFEKALQLLRDEVEAENHAEALRFLGAVSRADGRPVREDELFVRRLAEDLGVGEPSAPPAEDAVTRAYRALELPPGAGLEQVRAAYRRLALDYHPDKVEALAVGFREYATARMQAINEAYQLLRERLGGR